MRLLIVQFGDYAEAHERLSRGGEPDFYGQEQSIRHVARLARTIEVGVLCLMKDYDRRLLSNGVRAAGLDLYAGRYARHLALIRLVRSFEPTHLVLKSPILPLLGWAISNPNLRTLPLFADSFAPSGLKSRLKHSALASLLNLEAVDLVGNHSVAASFDLRRIGVSASKIVPWDWPKLLDPEARDAKSIRGRSPDAPFRLCYAGSLTEAKGVGDLVRAVAVARARGRAVEATIVGGDASWLRDLISSLGLGSHIAMRGRLPQADVLNAMNAHDAVVVPSRHEYPEGRPNTIYEAICSRSPLIASDHPMFDFTLRDDHNCLSFEASNPESFADAIARLSEDSDLYERLSTQAPAFARTFGRAVMQNELIDAWLDGRTDPPWVFEHALAGPRYRDLETRLQGRDRDPVPERLARVAARIPSRRRARGARV